MTDIWPLDTVRTSLVHRHVAYRRGLCVSCQQVAPAAGMTRCWPCHSAVFGVRLTPDLQQRAVIRRMSGPVPSPEIFVLAWFVAAVLAAPRPVMSP